MEFFLINFISFFTNIKKIEYENFQIHLTFLFLAEIITRYLIDFQFFYHYSEVKLKKLLEKNYYFALPPRNQWKLIGWEIPLRTDKEH